jgi:pimeloyl-ACP methyl ester carboxylesterase
MARKSRTPESPAAAAPVEAAPPVVVPQARDFTYSSFDGLKLHARDHGDPLSPWLPVVCLPGLTRGVRDFEEIAVHLSTHRHRPRRVVVFEYRGRGRSEWDENRENYNPLTEMTDIFDGMGALGIPRAVLIGTSRGGIIAMLMGVARPGMLAGLVLNDIGPVIEPIGLARIKTYVGRTPAPDDWPDARRLLRRLHGAQFTALNEEDWDAFARMTYRDEDGRPVADYDPALAETFDGVEFDRPVPTLWDQFQSLRSLRVLTIRGENSDFLSAATLAAMAAAHPRFESITVTGEGHPPLLRHAPLLQHISAFITHVEGSGPPADAVIPRASVAFDLDAPRQNAEAE